MGGTNPYQDPVNSKLPTTPYTITVYGEDGEPTTIEVDPTKIPYDHNGLPGSLLDILLGHGIEVDHACGGVCACSTCHIYVEDGGPSCNESTDDEEDMLDHARALKPTSRLACQVVPDGTTNIVVRIPGWNRNLAREAPH